MLVKISENQSKNRNSTQNSLQNVLQTIVTVTLNRPEVRNAFNAELISQLTQIFSELSVRKDIRAIVLRGEGSSFCAGADLQMMQNTINDSFEKTQDDANLLFSMFDMIAKCPHPIIGVVHGAAFGGALGLIACCDIVLCEEKTKLCFSEVKLGIVPAVISAFVLKKCSLGKIAPWMISGQLMTAQDGFSFGLIHEITTENQIEARLQSWLKLFKECGPEAVQETKKLILKIADLDWTQTRKETTRIISERRVSKEGQEGLRSFLEKRQPSWKSQ